MFLMDETHKLDAITRRIIGAAIEVHRRIGPGLLESAYNACLSFELREMGFRIEEQLPLPVIYRDVKLDCGYRMDFVVEDAVIIEIKAMEQLAPVEYAQLLSYLRLADKRVGLLINFHLRMLKDGIKRIVNDFPEPDTKASNAEYARYAGR
jgi:GxxExxY protein